MSIEKIHYNTFEWTTEAQHFKEFGVYTKSPVGSKSWELYWQEMRNRCINGYNIGRDKITGYNFFLLNFCPILQTVTIKENEFGQNQAARIKDFPLFFDGQYDWFWYLEEAELSGEHAMLLGSRGRGKSLMCASLGVRNYHHIRDSKSYYVAARENYLLGDGIMPKVWDLMNYIDQNTPWSKRRHEKNTELHRRASVRITTASGVETIDPRSYNSEIIGITVGDSPQKLRGIRGKIIIFEEFGSFKNGDKAWNICRPTMEDGKNTFGTQIAIATGGDEGSDFQAAEELFNNPESYNIKPTQNIYDEGLENTNCAFFYPADRNYSGAMDKDGNSDREKARRFIEEDRKKVARGNDPHALTRRKAEIPLTPREAMMRISGTLFPIDELKKQEAEIISKPHKYKDADFIGRLELNKETQQFEFINDREATVIYQFPLKDNKNLPGGIAIYSHPHKDNSGNVYENRYCAGIDPYDHDESSTTSLGSCFIGDLWTKKIVAEYTGRPKSAEIFYENCRRLLLYYKAIANIENANKGIFDYLDKKNCGYLIMDEPRIARETLENTSLKNNNSRRRRGTTPSEAINRYGRGLLAKWCMESTNNEELPEEIQLHRFRCLPAIKEMTLWNIDGNFDRVSSLIQLMIAFSDREKYNEETSSDHKSLAQDDWFKRNYKK
jgi:hypothetical protein